MYELTLQSNVFCSLFSRMSAERYPKLAEYYDQVKERPSIKTNWPPHWLENKGEDRLIDI